MGLPAYIINHDELKHLIIKCINDSSLSIGMEGAVLKGVTLDVNTTEIDNSVESIKSILENESVSYSELYMEINNVVANLTSGLIGYQTSMDKVILQISLLVAEKYKIKKLLQDIYDLLEMSGRQKAFSLSTFAGSNDSLYFLSYDVEEEIALTAITIEQDRYDYNDFWSLMVNNRVIFDSVYTKYTSERKKFNSLLKLKPNDNIQILFYNNSLGNKTINYDIEYLVL